MATHSILNVLFVFVPIAWVGHFLGEHTFGPAAQFTLSFLAIIPLEHMFDMLAESMVPYIGAELGDLLECTLNNAVEAALAIFLLVKDRYRLLQTTIIGVVLLHLLLIPGVAFMSGGARVMEQDLHAGSTELNHSLLTLGVMAIVLPAAFFAALDRGTLSDLTSYAIRLNANSPRPSEEHGTEPTAAEGSQASETTSAIAEAATAAAEHVVRALGRIVRRAEEHDEDPQQFVREHFEFAGLLTDKRREHFLHFSRGIAILLLMCYVASRIYLHNPPGQGNALQMNKNTSDAVKEKAKRKENRDPEVNPWVGAIAIVICIALMAVTAEWLVDSIEPLQIQSGIAQEWFGLFLLPIISWAADGLITLVFFAGRILRRKTQVPESVASSLAIDLSIQFLLFWMPFLILIAWWTSKPFTLLFDLLEIVMLVAACFLVNFVTADAKTNWAEGSVMVAFYIMISVVSWFYPGQPEVRIFNGRLTIAEALVQGPSVEG
ncbi:hypothetical protein BKA62DRAFT_621162 [Auriculariales sp. MPI-PUGE-AT-0066]|nr:hypothetical protein BKA62DRAFT_621162 [Auriculariales sp. MPI-PUGE-AT-0066]